MSDLNNNKASRLIRTAFMCGSLALAGAGIASAATWCVNPNAPAPCVATISAAIAAASPNDQIQVAAGEYTESVIIPMPLVITGAGPDSTIINAKGLSNGIYIDGLDNPGLMNVQISGFTIQNANYEGILVTNAAYVVISNNVVLNNDQSLNYSAATCPGQPVFETSEAEDCGEGIHLVGVAFSTVGNNTVEFNSGGILLSDETGITYENQIIGNSVHDNALDCGITLASHPPSPQASSKLPYGVVNNYIFGNNSSSNGLIGAGAGIGIFAPGPGNQAYGNQVVGNTITNNGLPGVTVHNHAAPPGAPGVSLNAIRIVGNYISGNAADTEDATTPGTAGINIYSVAPAWSVTILENTIVNEQFGVVMNNPGSIDMHLNNLPATGVGIANIGQGVLNGTMNYFGCAGGAGATGCSSVMGPNLSATPALAAPVASTKESGSSGTGAAPRIPRP